MLKRTLLCLCLFGLIVTLLQAQISEATGVVVKTKYGRVKGFVDEDTKTFTWLDIPYAKPPVGELRWKPPQEPDSWSGILKTEEFGNACAQVGSLYGPPDPGEPFGLSIIDYLGLPSGCEDCLTLNIWRPSPWSKKERLPVIVFIHGGSNKQSYAADPMWHGGNLARKANAVVVTVNYRLGVFGWFAHPALRTGDALNDSANFGGYTIFS
jgi:para-nitrobenzyl esterase